MQAAKIPDTLERVKDALDVWAEWMQRDETRGSRMNKNLWFLPITRKDISL